MAQTIFVSYARIDQDFALRLAKALCGFGFDVWIDQLDIAAGKRWDREIEIALEACPAFLIVMSQASVASDNVLDEVNFALEHGKDIVPVLYRPCNVPFRLRRFQHVDFTGDEAAALTVFESRLQRLKTTNSPPVVTATGNVKTWPTATVNQGDLLREQEVRAATASVAAATPPRPLVRTDQYRVMVGPKGQEEERWLKPGDSIRDLPHAPEMVLVPPGKFWMGSKDAEGHDDERPRHEVTIGYPLLVGKYPVTFYEWDAAVAAGGVSRRRGDEGWGRARRPVINVSWADASAYASWLSKATGQTYRLLSEAEWEYACRAGTETPYSFGDTISKQQAQFSEDRWGSAKQTVEVRRFPANAFGFYDMHGNVWEWCEDPWHGDYKGAPGDGSVWASGGDASRRVLRGGSWSDFPQNLRSALRFRYTTDYRINYLGFRVGRTLER